MCQRIVNDYTRTHIFRDYLRENKKFRETVFFCSFGSQVEFFVIKKCRKSRDTVPLKLIGHYFDKMVRHEQHTKAKIE